MIDSAIFAGVDMATFAPAARLLRFDDFELDVRAGELRKRGVKVRLQGQPLHVLAALLNRAGDVVTREELRAQIWPADAFVDFDHSLHNAVARLATCSATPPRRHATLKHFRAAGTGLSRRWTGQDSASIFICAIGSQRKALPIEAGEIAHIPGRWSFLIHSDSYGHLAGRVPPTSAAVL